MSLFKKTFIGAVLGNGLPTRQPEFRGKEVNIFDKVDMLLTDVETEGKKQGYDRAAKEYGKVYRAIEKEYKETLSLIETQKNNYDSKAEVLIKKLEMLEAEKARLEKQVNTKTREVSRKYNIPVSTVTMSMANGSLFDGGMGTVGVLDLVYSYKEKKLRAAEQKGYAEARELYEKKINNLKAELKRLQEKGNKEIRELLSMIDEVFIAIADEQMKIAELKILL